MCSHFLTAFRKEKKNFADSIFLFLYSVLQLFAVLKIYLSYYFYETHKEKSKQWRSKLLFTIRIARSNSADCKIFALTEATAASRILDYKFYHRRR